MIDVRHVINRVEVRLYELHIKLFYLRLFLFLCSLYLFTLCSFFVWGCAKESSLAALHLQSWPYFYCNLSNWSWTDWLTDSGTTIWSTDLPLWTLSLLFLFWISVHTEPWFLFFSKFDQFFEKKWVWSTLIFRKLWRFHIFSKIRTNSNPLTFWWHCSRLCCIPW